MFKILITTYEQRPANTYIGGQPFGMGIATSVVAFDTREEAVIACELINAKPVTTPPMCRYIGQSAQPLFKG